MTRKSNQAKPVATSNSHREMVCRSPELQRPYLRMKGCGLSGSRSVGWRGSLQ